MGIDQASDAAVSNGRNGGQADFLRLVVIDSEADTVSQIQIDRDTMTPITILGVLGNRSGVRTTQICLAHSFGDRGAESCELTVEAVSNLLLGTQIDDYIAMNLDGVSVLNDWGGRNNGHARGRFLRHRSGNDSWLNADANGRTGGNLCAQQKKCWRWHQ